MLLSFLLLLLLLLLLVLVVLLLVVAVAHEGSVGCHLSGQQVAARVRGTAGQLRQLLLQLSNLKGRVEGRREKGRKVRKDKGRREKGRGEKGKKGR